MRWDCERQGCFNEKRRPKLEVFADCFPGRISFGDVDGMVEIDGRFCLLEWKGEGGQVGVGQRIAYERLTNDRNAVFVVEGDAETMEVRRYCVFYEGRQGEWIDADLGDVKVRIRKWVEHAKR